MTANVIPNVPENVLNRDFEIYTSPVQNPLQGVWWATQSISDVPENIMGWLVAQGFEVTGIRQDKTTVPPTNYFSVTKQGLLRQPLLTDLCNNYTYAANEARLINQYRYNEIVKDWTEMISTTHDQFDAQVDEQNLQSGIFLTDLDQYMTAIETMIADNQAQVVIDANDAKVALEDMLSRLEDLETNATNNSAAILSLFAEQRTNLLNFVNTYNLKLAELDQNFAAYLAEVISQIQALGVVTDSHIAGYLQQFSVLASNYTAHAANIQSRIDSITVTVDGYAAEVDAILAQLELDYSKLDLDLNLVKTESGNLVTQFSGDYDAILSLITNDYASHAAIARGFLNNLGQTELARINEQFAASLSVQMQMLVSKGLSQSTIPIDFTAKNQRDRDENIQALNDRLNREKLEDQHRLYGQQANVRSTVLQGKERLHSVRQEVLRYQASLVSSVYLELKELRNRVLAGKQVVFAVKDANAKYATEIASSMYSKLQDVQIKTIESSDRVYQIRDVFAKWRTENSVRRYEQIQQVEAQFLDAIQKQNAARQDVTKTEITIRNELLTQIQSALSALMSGKERYATLLMQNSNALADHKHKAIAEMMNTAVQRLDGWKSVAAENTRLMAYQIDERNKLLLGLYSFVERREDIAPEWKDVAKMIAGLGDNGGGWLTPS